ncbi:MAG: BrnA antitoxin family protein [Gammaproteobacteria bacterium]|nr:BrnA antitoxin family protein [Gammaproteobacteria bacterium]
MKAVQYFSQEYLARCKNMSTEEIVQFLDDFRLIHAPQPDTSKSKLISIKIDSHLLNAFKAQSKLDGVPYQTRIKKLMQEWLTNKFD